MLGFAAGLRPALRYPVGAVSYTHLDVYKRQVKDVVTWAVIDKSSNPKYTTAFSKIKEYLASHNGSLEGFDVNSVEITEDEWLEIDVYKRQQ